MRGRTLLLACPYGNTSFRVFRRNLVCIGFATVHVDFMKFPSFTYCANLPAELTANDAGNRISMQPCCRHTCTTAAIGPIPSGPARGGARRRSIGEQPGVAAGTER